MSIKVLWLLVAYNNLAEVDDFVDHLETTHGGVDQTFAICDNSPSTGVSRHTGRQDFAFVARPDNPGYLDGGLAAAAAAAAAGLAGPDWIVLSNTDLVFEGSGLGAALASHDSSEPLVLAPRITEGPERIEKNPHVLVRRSNTRLSTNSLLGASPLTTMAYQAAGVLKLKARARGLGARADERQWNALHPAGTSFYSPYGAIIFFSRGFAPETNLPRGVPLLAEEYFIAEAASDLGAPVIYEPAIHVFHDAHTTTGPKVTWRRAKGTARAFRAIGRHARGRGAHRS